MKIAYSYKIGTGRMSVQWTISEQLIQVGVLKNNMRFKPSTVRGGSKYGTTLTATSSKISSTTNNEVMGRLDAKYDVFDQVFSLRHNKKILEDIAYTLVVMDKSEYRRVENATTATLIQGVIGGKTKLTHLSRATIKKKHNTTLGVHTGQLFGSLNSKTIDVGRTKT